MRVLHVMEATIGGTRRHLVDVVLGQVAAGLDVHVTAACERHAEFRGDLERLARAGVDVQELPMVREIEPLTDFAHVRALTKRVRSVRPDVVHTHSSKAGVLGRVASLRAGCGARVHTPHTFAFLFANMFGAAKRRLFRSVEVALARRTHLVVAVSAGEKATMCRERVVHPEQVRVVKNGIDPAPFESALPYSARELLGRESRPDALLVGVVGLLNVAKGQDLAVRALARPGCERFELVLAGHGEMEGALRTLAAELGVQERVTFLGWRRDVPRILRSLDALLLPSRWEGLPYVVLEAMAAGTPIVAARVDGAVELVEDGVSGFTHAIESTEELGAALVRTAACTHEQRRALGAAGRALVSREYTLTTMVERLSAVYVEAVALARERSR
jgi:glycosyltransferase involved in cell wall biosynthesis